MSYIDMYSKLRCFGCGLAVATLALWSAAVRGEDPQALWSKLKDGGLYILLRHAQTDAGSGDPPDFDINDCRTQRNLSEAGRAQAKRIGNAMRDRGVRVQRVRSSEFCRCKETAALAFGTVKPWPALNSIFETSRENDARVAALKQRLGEPVARERSANEVLVTHNVNISAATGVSLAMGEIVVVAPDGKGGFSVVGRLTAAQLDSAP
jgi:phosphohistidine phosphatase SixA